MVVSVDKSVRVKDLPAADSRMHCSSSMFLLTTRTLSETKYAELSNHEAVTASTRGLHESLSTGFGDRPQNFHELGLGHTSARILNRDG